MLLGTGEGAREIETGTELGRGQAEHSQGKLVTSEGTVPLVRWQIPLSNQQ